MRLTGDKVMNTFLGNLLEDKVKMKKVRYFLDFLWVLDGSQTVDFSVRYYF